jgi:hypothetical protein
MSNDMPLNAWADKDGIEPPDLGLTSQPQSPPWKDCKLLEPECKAKGYCVGHSSRSQSPPAGDTDNDEEIAAILSDLILVIRKKEPDLYSLAVVDALLSRPLAQLNAYVLVEILKIAETGQLIDPSKTAGENVQAFRDFIIEKATARFGAPADKLQGESE